MDEKRARTLLQAERQRVLALLSDAQEAQRLDQAEEQETADPADLARALTAEGLDDAFVST